MIIIESISLEVKLYRFAERFDNLSVFPEHWKGLAVVNSWFHVLVWSENGTNLKFFR